MSEDPNSPPASNPLLGTSTSQVLEVSWGSLERRSPESVCYNNLLRENGPSSARKSRNTVRFESSGCYGKLLRDLPRGVLRRGGRLYYRHTVPVDAQRLLNRLEIWRSLRTDSLSIALRRLPRVMPRIWGLPEDFHNPRQRRREVSPCSGGRSAQPRPDHWRSPACPAWPRPPRDR